MRILHVVTLITPEGAYGGPVRVAVNQCRELARRGHEVTLVAARSGFSNDPPTSLDSVPVRSFAARRVVPRTGFAGLAAPSLTRWVGQNAEHWDVVQIHLARDLITLPTAMKVLKSGTPLVIQTHGMVDRSNHVLARVFDPWLTFPVLARANAIIHLDDRERELLLALKPDLNRLHEVANGAELRSSPTANPARSREALYLARLQKRKNPHHFVAAATQLAARYPDWRFTLVGPDEGALRDIRPTLRAQSDRIAWEGPIPPSDVVRRMSGAAFYVLPAHDEPFPMTVLEAMSTGLPVIVTNTCGLAPSIERANCGIVTDGSVASLQSAMDRLLSNERLREELGQRGRYAAEHSHSLAATVDKLEAVYDAATPSSVSPEH